MDPPIINEASFSAANPSSYSLAEIWPFSTAANGGGNGDLGGGGLGLRMSSFTDLLEAAANSVNESTVTEQSGRSGGGGGTAAVRKRDVNSEDDSSKLVSTSDANDLVIIIITNFLIALFWFKYKTKRDVDRLLLI